MQNPINHRLNQSQTGYVLVIGLLLLLVLTLIAVTSMQTTTMDFRMSANLARKSDSFQSAESGQEVVSDLLDEHIFEHGWTTGLTNSFPAGFAINDKDGDGNIDDLYEDNVSGESLTDATTFTQDATYNNSTNGEINADIAVLKTQVIPATGSGNTMLAGYQGLGKSAASSGTHMYFMIHSEGSAKGSAKNSTQGNFRAVVRN